jgi:ligand-binding sensor domain-containing protein
MAQTPDGYLWLGTEFGLLRFDGVRNVPWRPPPDQQLPSNQIRSLLATRDGALWIGTDKGLSRWKPFESVLEGTAKKWRNNSYVPSIKCTSMWSPTSFSEIDVIRSGYEFGDRSAGELDWTNLRQTTHRLARIGCLSRFSS